MKKKFKKAATFCYSKTKDCIEIIFQSPASNQIRIQKTQPKRFRSYVQLKRYQKKLRRIFLRAFAGFILVLVGILIGPSILVPEKESEIYIPNGRGDILISSVSNSQARVVFKTFDLADDNRPFASVAYVNVYSDPEKTELFKKTQYSDYAFTHIIPITGLEEGRVYYLEIVAAESIEEDVSSRISFWGSGGDPIRFRAIGNPIFSVCPEIDLESVESEEKDFSASDLEKSRLRQKNLEIARLGQVEKEESSFIKSVQSEIYLYGRDKIQTIISWKTNELSSAAVTFRKKDSEEVQRQDIKERKAREHIVVLTELEPESTYYFRVEAESEDGKVFRSDEYSIRTPGSKGTIIDLVGENFKGLIKQMGF